MKALVEAQYYSRGGGIHGHAFSFESLMRIISNAGPPADQLAVLKGIMQLGLMDAESKKTGTVGSYASGEVEIGFCYPPPGKGSSKAMQKAYRKLISPDDRKRVFLRHCKEYSF